MFDGEGSYEVVATAYRSEGGELYRSVNVICLEKSKAFRNSIERDRNIRRAPTVVLTKREQVTRVYGELERSKPNSSRIPQPVTKTCE
jgi:hypothetical protein